MGELICAGWLLDGTGEQHKDWGILFQGQQVRDVGPATELLQTYPDSKVREEPGWVIAPGYLDAHDHGRALSPFWFGVKDCPLEFPGSVRWQFQFTRRLCMTESNWQNRG